MKGIDVWKILKMLEIQDRVDSRRSNNSNYALRCPFHKDGQEKTPSFYIHKKEGLCNCFSCGWKGSIYHLTAKIKNVDVMTAIRLITAKFDLDIRTLDLGIPEYDELLKQEGIVKLSESILTPYLQEKPVYMLNRGFSNEVIEQYKIGYNKTDNQVMIPIYDENKNLVGMQVRNLWANTAKYKNLHFQKTNILYGLYMVYKGCERIMVCEGITDVLRLRDYGYDAVAIIGSFMSEKQASLLVEWTDEVVLAFDNDEAGLRATKRAIEVLSSRVKVCVLDWACAADRKDIGECSKKEVDLLLDNRVWDIHWNIKSHLTGIGV